MKGKKIWGIELILMRDHPISPTPPPGKRPEYRAIDYQILLAHRTSGEPTHNPSRMFISSKELDARLSDGKAQHLQQMIGKELGEIHCIVNDPKRTITTVSYRPFAQAPGRRVEPFTDVFNHLGLATRIEQRMEEHLRQHYPGFSIQTTNAPKDFRRAQIEKRGRKVGEATPLEEAIRLSRAHARRNFQKSRIKPLSRPGRKYHN